MPDAAPRLPELVAHRGYPKRYPENTRLGVAAALDVGARFVEVDIQLTADRVPVLFHDGTLDRVCGSRGAVHERTLDELRELDVGERGRFGDRFADVRITPLDELVELLSAHPEVTTYFEIKPEAVAAFGVEPVVERVLDAIGSLAEAAVVISFLGEVLEEARRRRCRRLGWILRHWRDARSDEARRLDPEVLFCNVRRLPWFGRLDAASAGRPLAVYDVVHPGRAVALGRRGVALVETFAIGEMLASFAARRSGAREHEG